MDDRVAAVLRRDPVLDALIERYGPITLEPAQDPFGRLIRSITHQQVSLAAGDAILERLKASVELTPDGIRSSDRETLLSAGLSGQKADYVVDIADTFIERSYERETFVDMDDEAVIEELTDIHGVGPWTAKMFLIFCLGRTDVFPVEDLGIRRAMEHQIDPDLTREEMITRAENWRPYRSYGSLYLWESID